MKKSAQKYISIWLFVGLILVFFQVLIGGITRLTDSGLSITEWEIVKGVLPPMNETDWNEAFEKYQTYAKKQYEQLHADMTLPEFKKIYFWEWFHRLWARSMGIVFIIPFIFFLMKKWMPKWLLLHLAAVISLATLAAVFGWIMVASGLDNDNRTWVSAYKLVIHLSIATALWGVLFWTYLKVRLQPYEKSSIIHHLSGISKTLTALVLVQIVLGGLMAGMRAGSIHPHWPFFLGDNYLIQALFQSSASDSASLINYEGSIQIKAWVQVFHRFTAYLITGLSIFYLVKSNKVESLKRLSTANLIMMAILGIQVLLGILTIVNIMGSKIPVALGVAHQGVALLLLASWLYILFLLKNNLQKL